MVKNIIKGFNGQGLIVVGIAWFLILDAFFHMCPNAAIVVISAAYWYISIYATKVNISDLSCRAKWYISLEMKKNPSYWNVKAYIAYDSLSWHYKRINRLMIVCCVLVFTTSRTTDVRALGTPVCRALLWAKPLVDLLVLYPAKKQALLQCAPLCALQPTRVLSNQWQVYGLENTYYSTYLYHCVVMSDKFLFTSICKSNKSILLF